MCAMLIPLCRCLDGPRIARQVALLGAVLLSAPAGAAGDALTPLRQVVDEVCGCAAAQASGMDAAVRCTDGLRSFGNLKVAGRESWSEGQRREVGVLEQVIETCIANALDRAAARERLGLAAVAGAPGATGSSWLQVRPEGLASHSTTLARIHLRDGTTVKGMVTGTTGGILTVRRARSDGGGEAQVPVATIREAWVMDLR